MKNEISAASTPRARTGPGSGCLTLFALPFAAAGTFMLYLLISALWNWGGMQSWDDVPVRLIRVELESHRGDDSTTYSVSADYEYHYLGETFIGHRVGLHGESDNIGSFHRRAYRELTDYQRSGQTFSGFVDPEDPGHSVLYRQLRWELIGMYTLLALLFGGVGYGLIIGAMIGKRRIREEDRLKALYPDAPWKHRPDWAAGRIRSSSRAKMIGAIIFTTFWCLVSSPILFILPEEVLEKGNRLALIGLLFPLVGVGMIVWSIRAVIRWRKFGESVLVMDPVPAAVGGVLVGQVQSGVALSPGREFELTLSCIHKQRSGSGKNRRTTEHVLFQDTVNVAPESGFGAGGSTVPVSFAVPEDVPVCDLGDPDNRIFWLLDICADVPGVDYAARFEVPVFGGPIAPAAARTRTPADRVAASRPAFSKGRTESGTVDLSRGGVILGHEGGGVSFRFPAARTKGAALALTFFFALWSGFVALMLHLEAPILFPVLFGFFDILIFMGVIDLWLWAGRIEARHGRLSYQKGLLGLGRRHEIAASQIDSLKPARGMQSGKKLFYSIELTTREGQKAVIAKRLDSRRQAEGIIRRINESLG